MKELVFQLANEQLGELNFLLDNVLCIPEQVFRDYGTSGLGLALHEHALQPGLGDDDRFENLGAGFDELCNAAPHIPREAIKLFSQAYAGMSVTFFDKRFTYPGDAAALRMLMTVSTSFGGVLGVIGTSREASKEAQKEAQTLLAMRGASARHAENRAIKADVFKWLDSQPRFKSDEAAGSAITRQQPISHTTAKKWHKEWREMHSASRPKALPADGTVSQQTGFKLVV